MCIRDRGISAYDFGFIHFFYAFYVSQRRGGEKRHLVFFGSFKDGEDVGKRGGNGFVDKNPLACFKNGNQLFEVAAAVVGFEQYHIDFC